MFGLIPALQVSKPNVNDSLQQGSKGSTGGLHTNRLRSFLVISQVSLSLLLLAGAGLLMRSFFNLRAANPGFNPSRVVTMSLTLPKVKYPNEDQQVRVFDQVFAKLSALPGIEATGGVNPLPLNGSIRASTFTASGMPVMAPSEHPAAGHLIVMPDYFRAMKIPLLSGRAIDRRDTAQSPLVIMINEAFARKFFPGRNAIGERVMVDRDDNKAPPCEVVGVVGNSRHDALAIVPSPEFYVPITQDAQRRLDVVLRTSQENLAGLDTAVQRAIHEVDKDLFVPKLKAMERILSANIAQPRFNMVVLAIFAIFAGVAMILAAIGIYGVIAYSVTQRTREIGIRMALGAQRTQMLSMVLRESLTLVLAGLGIGIIVALATTRLLRTLLYGVGANDWTTYFFVVVLLGGAALLASYIPARRAMKVDPMVALRYE